MPEPTIRPEIPVETVCRIVVKARQFEVKEGVVEADYGGNAIDEGFREIIADHADDPVQLELQSFINDLNVDDKCELVALMWVGRGDFSSDDWANALAVARARSAGQTASYLLGTPQLADFLAEGLAAFDLSCGDFEAKHL
jgi:hypothetical protein